jgi:hypothetical protein
MMLPTHSNMPGQIVCLSRRSFVWLIALVFIVAAYSMWTRSSWPTDKRLIEHYASNRNMFQLLSENTSRNPSYTRVDLLSLLGIAAGRTERRARGVTFFPFSEDKLELDVCETDLMEKGFAYTEVADLETVESLDAYSGDFGIRFRRIDTNWYLYYSRFADLHCE